MTTEYLRCPTCERRVSKPRWPNWFIWLNPLVIMPVFYWILFYPPANVSGQCARDAFASGLNPVSQGCYGYGFPWNFIGLLLLVGGYVAFVWAMVSGVHRTRRLLRDVWPRIRARMVVTTKPKWNERDWNQL